MISSRKSLLAGGHTPTEVRHRLDTRQVHSGRLDPSFCTVVDGIPVTTVARSLVDLARTAGRRTAVTATDAALHEELCTVDQIVDGV